MADLEHLRSFLSVYRAGSISRASKSLHLSQPAVSIQIKSLESNLGRALFTRFARGIEATNAGHELARMVAPHIDALEAAGDSAREGSGDLRGTVFLGGPVELLTVRAIPAIATLTQQGISLRVEFGLADALIRQLRKHALDIVIATERHATRGIEFERLYQEDFVLVCAPSLVERLPQRALAARDPNALGAVGWIAYAEDLPMIRRYCRAIFGVKPPGNALLVAPDIRAVLSATVAGAGVTVLPRYLCERALARGELVTLCDPDEPPTNVIYLAHRAGTRVQTRIAMVSEVLKRSAKGW